MYYKFDCGLKLNHNLTYEAYMKDHYKVKPGDLLKVWAISRGVEYKQFTARVPAETFYKIKAIEAMFPGRSRNELVSDLLTTALDEFEEGLPFEIVECEAEGEPIAWDPVNNEPIFELSNYEVGPRAEYRQFVEDARRSGLKEVELKVVEEDEEVMS
jgi:hypothetical protein